MNTNTSEIAVILRRKLRELDEGLAKGGTLQTEQIFHEISRLAFEGARINAIEYADIKKCYTVYLKDGSTDHILAHDDIEIERIVSTRPQVTAWGLTNAPIAKHRF